MFRACDDLIWKLPVLLAANPDAVAEPLDQQPGDVVGDAQ